MSNLFDKWKESVITVYDSQEMSTLELLEDITNFNDEIAKGIDDLDLKIDTEINNLNLQKTDNLGDHKGSWQGLNKPTLSDEGMRATVEKLNTEIPKLENDIINVTSQLEQIGQQKADKNYTETINGRLENIIANNNPTEGNTELIDCRVSSSGIKFANAGSHVRYLAEGNVKNINHKSFDKKIFENFEEKQFLIDVVSGTYGGNIHGSLKLTLKIPNVDVTTVKSTLDFESNSGKIVSVKQKCQIGTTLLESENRLNTFTNLNDTFTFTQTTASSIDIYVWTTFSETGVNGLYKIKNWKVTVNNEEYDIMNLSTAEFRFVYNVTGTKTTTINYYNAIANNKSLNLLTELKNRIFGDESYNFKGAKQVKITNCYKIGEDYCGFVKNTIYKSGDITSIRVKASFNTFDCIKSVVPVINVTNPSGSENIVGNIYKCKNGDLVNIDYTFTPTKNNIGATKIEVFIRTHFSEDIKHTFEFGDFELYVNDVLIVEDFNTWVGWTIPYATGIITECKYVTPHTTTLKDENCMFFGDSITDTHFNPDAYPRYVAEISGCINNNYAVTGSGYCFDSIVGSSYWGKENTSITSMITRSVNDGITPKYIVVAGGTNDWEYDSLLGEFDDCLETSYTDTKSFYYALGETIRLIYNNYPLSKILFIVPLPRNRNGVNQHSINTRTGKKLTDYCKAIREVCEYFSIPYLDMMINSNLHLENTVAKNYYMPDGLHPSKEYASKNYAPMVVKKLETI